MPKKGQFKKGRVPWNKGQTKYPRLKDEDWLSHKYWTEKLSCREIAEIVGCSERAVRYALEYFGSKRRTASENFSGEGNPFYRRKHTEATKKKISENHADVKGKNNAFFGKHHTEGTRKVMQKKAKKRCESKEERERLVQRRKNLKMPTHHTKPELIFEEICKKYNLPFKYTGDGSFWIKNINPDFVECNGKKIVIEIFGDYWHSPLLQWGLREDRTLNYRKKILKKYGWELIVFWGTDLLRKDAEAFVLSVLKRIIENGKKD